MKKTTRILAMLLVLCMLFAFAACSNTQSEKSATSSNVSDNPTDATDTDSASSSDPIRIACLAPFSGNYAQYGEGYKAAIEMKLAEYNAAGGYNGREVVCDYFDDKCDAKEGVTAAQKIVNGDYLICLGPWSSTVGFAVSPLFDEAQMGLYVISASHNDLIATSDYMIRQTPRLISFAQADVRLAYEEMGFRTGCYLHYIDDTATLNCELYQKSFEALGGTWLGSESYTTGDTDFTAQLTKLIAMNPDVIWTYGSYADSAKIVIQARELGYEGHIGLTGAAYAQEFCDLAGELGEGCTDPVHMDPDLPEAVALAEAFNEFSGLTLNAHSYMAYDCIWHVLQGLDAVGPDRQALVDYLRNDKNAVGTFGTVEYTDGENNARVFPVIVKDGRFCSYELKNTTLEQLAIPIDIDLD